MFYFINTFYSSGLIDFTEMISQIYLIPLNYFMNIKETLSDTIIEYLIMKEIICQEEKLFLV